MATPDPLSRLYRDIVLDHSRNPRNFGPLEGASHRATGYNALCGDKLTLYLQMNGNGRIDRLAFEATGCAISLASGSMLTEIVSGKNATQAQELAEHVHSMLSGAGHGARDEMGDIAALAGVRAYPSRVRCATLPWRTLEAALHDAPEPVTTERDD